MQFFNDRPTKPLTDLAEIFHQVINITTLAMNDRNRLAGISPHRQAKSVFLLQANVILPFSRMRLSTVQIDRFAQTL
jgi:hypothetical protein